MIQKQFMLQPLAATGLKMSVIGGTRSNFVGSIARIIARRSTRSGFWNLWAA